MHIYKLTPDDREFKTIVAAAYALETQKRRPWYQPDESGRMRHYAVCPACDNPIRLIGIAELARNTDKPYGKHVPASIPGLAPYDQAAYDYCPLAAKSRVQPKKSERKSGMNPLSVKVIETVRREFDRIVLVIQEATGVMITDGLARTMLEHYLGEKGYLYSRASLINVPWIFAYMSDSLSLVGRIIFDEALRQAIIANVPEADFNNHQLVKKGSAFLSVNMCFLEHKIVPNDTTVEESIVFSVSTTVNGRPYVFFTKKIDFDFARFQYLTTIPAGKGSRKQSLLDLAARMLVDFEE